MKPNFTFALIARNEAKTIPHLMGSLKEFTALGGEVLILDTGSTDDTAHVARDLGAIVHEVGGKFLTTIDKEMASNINEFFLVEGETDVLNEGDTLFDFAAARNYIASLSKTDWVWMPDCDEVFSTLNLQAIDDAIGDIMINRLEYEFIFSHDENGQPAIRFMHSKMYRKSQLEWAGVVHEVLKETSDSKHLGARYLSQDQVLLEHYQNVETNRSGYLRGLALDCYLHPDSDRNSHYFARELLWAGRPKSAINEFERHIAMGKWQTEASQSMIYIGDAKKQIGDNPVENYQKAYNMESGRREPLIRLAEWYMEQKDFQKVVAYVEMAMTIPRSNFYADYQEHYTYKPHEMLYLAYWYLGDNEKSKEHYDIAASYRPHHPAILTDRQFYYPLPKVTFIIPTLGRAEGLKRCLRSIDDLIYPADLKEALVIEGDEKTVPQKVVEGLEHATGDYIVYAANDIEFTPTALMIALLEDADLVSFNTGAVLDDEGNICEHFMIKKDFINKIGGEIFDTQFFHVGVDNLLWAKAKKFGKAVYCKDAIVYHYHFSRGGTFDGIYEKGWSASKVNFDRALLEKKLADLNA